jgi:CRP-like cAMP-binding protein
MEASALASVPLFDGLDQAIVERWASLFQETTLLSGSGLAREGEFAYKFFVVLDGEVEVQRDFQHVATLGSGDFFGEMGVLTGGRRNARVIALTRCRLAWMMGWDFETLTKEHPEVAERIQRVVDERMASVPDAD